MLDILLILELISQVINIVSTQVRFSMNIERFDIAAI